MATIKEQQEQSMQIAYAEAMRYMSNAEEILPKAGKEGNLYCDDKYVRVACGTAYLGALKALDAYFEIKGVPHLPKKKRESIDYYKSNLAQIDKKMLSHLNIVYNILHLDGYYEGVCSVPSIRSGFDFAYEIIARIKPARELTPDELKALNVPKIPAWLRALYTMFFA
jgi:hypothetical protein